MTVRQVTVSVDDDHVDQIDTVAAALRHRGMHVDQVMGALGVINGTVPDETRSALSAVEGVLSVDEALGVQLPPPGSSVQ